MATKQNKPRKPSDFTEFSYVVFLSSATLLDFDQYISIYGDTLRILFWNPDIDTPLAIKRAEEGFKQ